MATFYESVIENYDLAPPVAFFDLPAGKNNKIIGVRSGQGNFALKILDMYHHSPGSLDYEHQLLRWLDAQRLSFFLPLPLNNRSGGAFTETPAGYCVVVPLLRGKKTYCTDLGLFEMVGAKLGELHRTLAQYPVTPRPGMTASADFAQIHPLIPHPNDLTAEDVGLLDAEENRELFTWWRNELAAIREFVHDKYAALPLQVIHGDYGHMNTLYEGRRITAIIDFEFAGPDARVLDLASALCFCKHIQGAPGLIESFFRGYGSRQQLTPAEIAVFPWIMRFVEATAAIWQFGRQLAAGVKECKINRLHKMRMLKEWLGENKTYVEAMLSRHLLDKRE